MNLNLLTNERIRKEVEEDIKDWADKEVIQMKLDSVFEGYKEEIHKLLAIVKQLKQWKK